MRYAPCDESIPKPILPLGESVINKHKRLTKILAIPYFGRIDFLEKKENSKVMPIYIGIHTFL